MIDLNLLTREELEKAYMRYEFVRTLNPRLFGIIWKRSISGEGRFDDLIDAQVALWKKFKQP